MTSKLETHQCQLESEVKIRTQKSQLGQSVILAWGSSWLIEYLLSYPYKNIALGS